jgi:hypothetical protein
MFWGIVSMTDSTYDPAFVPGVSMFLDAIQSTSVAPFLDV